MSRRCAGGPRRAGAQGMRCVGGARRAGNGQGARASHRCVERAVKILTDTKEKTSRSAMMARMTASAADRACPGGKSSKGEGEDASAYKPGSFSSIFGRDGSSSSRSFLILLRGRVSSNMRAYSSRTWSRCTRPAPGLTMMRTRWGLARLQFFSRIAKAR